MAAVQPAGPEPMMTTFSAMSLLLANGETFIIWPAICGGPKTKKACGVNRRLFVLGERRSRGDRRLLRLAATQEEEARQAEQAEEQRRRSGNYVAMVAVMVVIALVL